MEAYIGLGQQASARVSERKEPALQFESPCTESSASALPGSSVGGGL